MNSRLYAKMRDYLASHKRVALFLSHGGLHVVVLLCLIACFCLMAYSLSQSTKSEPIVIDFEFGDRSLQSKLTNFFLLVDADLQNNSKISFSLYTAYHDTWYNHTRNRQYEPYIKTRINKRTQIRRFTHNIDSVNTKVFEGDFGELRFALKGESADSLIINSSDYSRTHVAYRDNIAENKISFSGSLSNDSWIKNPYYSLFIRFHYNPLLVHESVLPMSTDSLELDSSNPFPSKIKIIFKMDKFDMEHPQLVSYTTIQPTPSKVGFDYVLYDNPVMLREILNNGIYIEAENVAMARKVERKAFLFSVLMGTVIAFMLDVIITLILKWRRLAK